MPAVVLRDSDKFGPRPGTIHAHAQCVWTKKTAPSEAISTMTAGDVSSAHDEIAAQKSFYVIAYGIDNPHKLVADYHRHGNGFLRPGVPVIDMNVGSTDG